MLTIAVCSFVANHIGKLRDFIGLVNGDASVLVVFGDICSGSYTQEQVDSMRTVLEGFHGAIYLVPQSKHSAAFVKDYKTMFDVSTFLRQDKQKVIFDKTAMCFVPGHKQDASTQGIVILENDSKLDYYKNRYYDARFLTLDNFQQSFANSDIVFSCIQPQIKSWQNDTRYVVAEDVDAFIEGEKSYKISYAKDSVITKQDAEELDVLGFAVSSSTQTTGSKRLLQLLKKSDAPFVIVPSISDMPTTAFAYNGSDIAENRFVDQAAVFVGHLGAGYGAIVNVDNGKLQYHALRF